MIPFIAAIELENTWVFFINCHLFYLPISVVYFDCSALVGILSDFFTVVFLLLGLTLEFNIQQSEYISALAPDAGIRVSIHERGTYPFPEDDGFTISPGSASSVALQQVNTLV